LSRLNRDYAHESRRSRHRSRFPAGPVALLALLVVLLIVVGGTFSRLKGPVSTPAGLRGLRTAQREALAERAFLNAQLALAGRDSISIVIDARQGRLWIALKGVKLRECRLQSVGLDATIRSLVADGDEALWLERPFTLRERRGNLPDPWAPVREGPVDTLKGATAVKELPMEGSLVFDRRLVIHIDTPPTAADSANLRGFKGFRHRFDRRLTEARAELAEIVHGPATLDLYVRFSREDAAAVLRALSVGGWVALHI
jgi:hypothetical protein